MKTFSLILSSLLGIASALSAQAYQGTAILKACDHNYSYEICAKNQAYGIGTGTISIDQKRFYPIRAAGGLVEGTQVLAHFQAMQVLKIRDQQLLTRKAALSHQPLPHFLPYLLFKDVKVEGELAYDETFSQVVFLISSLVE